MRLRPILRIHDGFNGSQSIGGKEGNKKEGEVEIRETAVEPMVGINTCTSKGSCLFLIGILKSGLTLDE